MSKRVTLASLLCALLLFMNLALMVGMHAANADTEYVVQRGDNLTAIAQKFNVSVDTIAKTNNLANVNVIHSGLRLKIPTGNPAPATQPAETKPAPVQGTGEQAYIVQRGDTLTAIADRFNISVSALASANGLSVMSYVYVGQVLKIPGTTGGTTNPAPVAAPPTATPAPQPTATPKPATNNSGNTTVHTVASGDTLSSIAAQYNVSWEAVANYNNITNPNVLYIGQKLNIPAAGTNPAPKPTQPPAQPAANPVSSGKWIDVKLSRPQRLTAYEGNKAVFSTLVSAGSTFPTPTGTFNVYIRYRAQAMSGPGYYLPGVPYVLYFYQNYAIHGTYWHNNFGNPMSHGCVNLPTPAAEWIYNWAGIGTPVKIHW
jgi:LysM repeat protein